MALPERAGYQGVVVVLAEYEPGDMVSTRLAIADIREQIPYLAEVSDDEIVALIVSEARVKGVALCFDHKCPSE